jgi:arylsulfatase A-like enzyme
MKRLFIVLLVCTAYSTATKADPSAKTPMNVLILMCDDLNTWLLDDPNRYAGKVIAPNIKTLGESGVVFRRAYTASPACAPSRSALFSGVSPWRSGLYRNGVQSSKSDVLNAQPSMGQVFREHGYHTAAYGKITHGWDPKGSWNEKRGHKRDPSPPGAPLMPLGRGENDWGVIHLDESEMNDTMNADAAIAVIKQPHRKPFFIAYGTFNPHMPWYVPKKYFDMFPLDDVEPAPINLDDLSDIPPLGLQKAKRKDWIKQLMEIDEYKKGVQAYLATTAYADAQIGRVLDALDESPHRDNTIVVLVSDHGFHLGEKLNWQKNTLWEEATHSLLTIRVPGVTKPGGASERFVSLQDIYPTLVELCGLILPKPIDGRSLTPLLKDPASPWKSTAITAHEDRHITIRTEKYRYIRYNNEQEEFYDITKDPNEWTNEINNPDYTAAITELRTKLPSLENMAPLLPRPEPKMQ